MLAWWLIFAELGAARARAIPIPPFLQELRLERSRRWPCFLASGLFHLAMLGLLPALSDWLEATRPEHWVRRYRMLPSVEIRVPERLYLAATPRIRMKGAPRRTAASPARGLPARKLSARTASRSGSGPRRRFELPRLPARATDQTLLQPDLSADLPVLARISLPDLFFWAPLPRHPAFRVRKPFVTPGSAEPFAQPPAFDAPPQLTAPNWEAIASAWQAASTSTAAPNSLLVPSISLPIRFLDLLPKPARTHISVERAVGDPLSVLALNQRVRPVQEDLVIPTGLQLAQGEPVAGGAGGHEDSRSNAEAGSADRSASPISEQTNSQSTLRGEHAPRGEGTTQTQARAQADTRARISGQPVTETRPENADRPASLDQARGVPSTASLDGGTPVPRPADDAATVAHVAPSEPQPRQAAVSNALRIEHPAGAVADVVVVQPAPMDGMLESTGALSGRPVYTVFLQVGAPREWILQYCVPGEDQSVRVAGGVVRLIQPGPLLAPYPKITYLPPVRPRPNSYLLIHGYLGADGHFENLTALRGGDREEAAAIVPVLQRWEFRPAMRDGQPIRVEILLAIPRS